MMETKILNRRATLFVNTPMIYNDQTLPDYIQSVAELKLIPSLNKGLGVKIAPDGSVIPEQMISLDLKNIEDSFKVTLGIDRFDIVSSLNDNSLDCFLQKVKEVINALNKIYSGKYNRLALGSVCIFYITPEKMNLLYNKMVNTESEELPVEWSIRKVIRTAIENEKYRLVINNVYTISRRIVIEDGSNTDSIVLEHDINTLVGSDLSAIADLSDLFIQKAPASTVGDLAEAVQRLFGETEVKIIGARHGEKLFETLMTREERLRSEDMGKYYRVKSDARDLNYDKFVVEGKVVTMAEESYTSDNTERLDVEGTISKIMTAEYVQKALENKENEVAQ